MNATIDGFEFPARFAVLCWEPVAYTGERLNVGAIAEFRSQILAAPLIREDVLKCMYGTAGEGAANMIGKVLESVSAVGKSHGWDAAIGAIPLANFQFHAVREIDADSEADLFRQIILMHCSLSVMADEMDTAAEDTPAPEREFNQKWSIRIREAIQLQHPQLGAWFNREAVLVEDGIPVKFGFLGPRLAAHFGLLRGGGQAAGMKDARAKLWELALAKARNEQMAAALICGTPGQDDMMLSDRQRDQLSRNTRELEHEAKTRNIGLRIVHSIPQAVASRIELA